MNDIHVLARNYYGIDEVSRQNADISTKRRERSQNTNTHERQRRVNRTP